MGKLKNPKNLKGLFLTLLFAFLLGTSAPLYALQDPNGLMNFKWGETVDTVEKKALASGMKAFEHVLQANPLDGVSHLSYSGQALGYGGKYLFAFSNGKLFSVEVLFEKRGGEVFEKIAERMGEQYGEPEPYGNIFAPHWAVGNTLIVVSVDGNAAVSLGSVDMAHLRNKTKPDEPLTLEQLDRMFQGH